MSQIVFDLRVINNQEKGKGQSERTLTFKGGREDVDVCAEIASSFTEILRCLL